MQSTMADSVDTSNLCVLCCKNFEIFAFGACDHIVCFECSTRMRVLCRQNECPICRQDLPQVVFVRKVQKFSDIHWTRWRCDRKYRIYFESSYVINAYDTLLEHRCSICKNEKSFSNFHQLKEHLRKDHEHFFCNLCVDNLKIFSFERSSYSRADLALHRRRGDTHNTSHKGHPLCQFCDERYLDNDELFRHLRRDHFFCHFCDTDGLQEFYSHYPDLLNHFREKHFLCEEGDCKEEKFTAVFRTDIDFKVHKANVHNKNWSKAQAKQARMLELEFTYKPRSHLMGHKGSGEGIKPDIGSRNVGPPISQTKSRYVSREEGATGGSEPPVPVPSCDAVPSMDSSKDFPTLNSMNIPPTHSARLQPESFAQRLAKKNRFTVKNCDQSGRMEDFPSLSDDHDQKILSPKGCWSSKDSKVLPSSSAKAPSKHSKSGHLQLTNGDFPSLPTNSSRFRNFSASGSKTQNANSAINKYVLHPTNQENLPSTTSALPESKLNTSVRKPKPANFSDKDFPQLKSSANATSELNWPPTNGSDKSRNPCMEAQIVQSENSNKNSKGINKSKNENGKKTSGENGSLSLQGVADSLFQGGIPSSIVSGKLKMKVKKQANNARNSDAKENLNSKPTERAKEKENETNKEIKSHSKATLDFLNTLRSSNTKDSNHNDIVYKMDKETEVFGIGDFPELPTKSKDVNSLNLKTSSQQPNFLPPGFSTAVPSTNKPPPGFQLALKSTEQNSNANNVTAVPLSGSNEKNFCLKYSAHEMLKYHQPENFEERNCQLIDNIRNIVKSDESHFTAFKYLSGQFRRGLVSASNYYEQCTNLIGPEFSTIFPELLVLLPDIEKQKELLSVHNNCAKEKILDSIEDVACGKMSQFLICATCQQVLAGSDFRKHMEIHNLVSNFPLLN